MNRSSEISNNISLPSRLENGDLLSLKFNVWHILKWCFTSYSSFSFALKGFYCNGVPKSVDSQLSAWLCAVMQYFTSAYFVASTYMTRFLELKCRYAVTILKIRLWLLCKTETDITSDIDVYHLATKTTEATNIVSHRSQSLHLHVFPRIFLISWYLQ